MYKHSKNTYRIHSGGRTRERASEHIGRQARNDMGVGRSCRCQSFLHQKIRRRGNQMHGRSDGFLHRLAVVMNVSFRPEGTATTQRAREGGARAAAALGALTDSPKCSGSLQRRMLHTGPDRIAPTLRGSVLHYCCCRIWTREDRIPDRKAQPPT